MNTISKYIVLMMILSLIAGCADKKYGEDPADFNQKAKTSENHSPEISIMLGMIDDCNDMALILSHPAVNGDFVINASNLDKDCISELASSGAKLLLDAGKIKFDDIIDIVVNSSSPGNIAILPEGLDNKRILELLELGVRLKYDANTNPFDILFAADYGVNRVDILARGIEVPWLYEYLKAGANIYLDESFDLDNIQSLAIEGKNKVKTYFEYASSNKLAAVLDAGGDIIINDHTVSFGEIEKLAEKYPGQLTIIINDMKRFGLNRLNNKKCKILFKNK